MYNNFVGSFLIRMQSSLFEHVFINLLMFSDMFVIKFFCETPICLCMYPPMQGIYKYLIVPCQAGFN